MPNVLIRDVPASDLDQVRSAAAAQGMSLQNYLRSTVQAQAAYLRRQTALAQTAKRLHGRPDVPNDARRAVLDAIETAHAERTDQLGDRPTP